MKALIFVIAAGTGIGLMLPTGESPAPATTAPAAGRARVAETRLEQSGGGHFYVNAEVNGQLVRFVVDTGATSVALTMEDAERIGIPFSPGEFDIVGTGASGPVRGKPITLDKISVEGKEVIRVRGAVLEGLEVSLLGQTYLSRIRAVEMRGDYMILR
jgi:aspartyl protease family protein